jgi:SAM-dependent methyltransferase
MTSTKVAAPVAPPEVKAKHRVMWALGDYPAVAADVIPSLGPVAVEAAGIGPGDRVLDVAAGSGNASIPAARTGATVVASDLTPELLDTGRTLAAEAGVELAWEVGDAEALPYGDASFDAVISVVGVMFAPFHQAAADELVRVARPGGRIGLVNWTPGGFIGQMFATMKPYAPPPPAGAQPPPLWGDEGHVRTLLGDRVTDVVATPQRLVVDCFASAEEFRDFFKATYGPTIAVYKAIADDPAKVAALDEALVELGRRHDLGGGTMEWEYLLFTARRA